MSEIDDLELLLDKIVDYLKEEEFAVFFGQEISPPENERVIEWSQSRGDWTDFLKAAKIEGVKTIVIDAKELSESQIDANLRDESTEPETERKFIAEYNKKLRAFKKHAGKIGEITLFWVRNGARFQYSRILEWWLELNKLTGWKISPREIEVPEEIEELRPMLPIEYRVSTRLQIPKELKEKSAEQLADELVKFTEKEFPDARTYGTTHEVFRLFWVKKGLTSGYTDDPEIQIKMRKTELLAEQKVGAGLPAEIAKKTDEELVNEILGFLKEEFPDEEPIASNVRLYWEEKGIQRYASDPEAQIRMRKVETLVLQRITQERIQREKELIPKLVEECVGWAIENQLKKVTKSNVDFFLSEKGVQLSKTHRDAIYNQVNLKLQRR